MILNLSFFPTGATPLSNDYNTLQISPFIVFLNNLCNDLTSENNKDLKWLILDKIPKGTLEGCQKARDTISIMLEMNLINEHDLNLLRELLEKVNRQDLASKVQDFVQTRSFIDGASRSGKQKSLFLHIFLMFQMDSNSCIT